MSKNFLFFPKISLSENFCEIGGIFFLPQKIIWIGMKKRRIIQIFSEEFFFFFWLNSTYRNKIIIEKSPNQTISFCGFLSSSFNRIKFFFLKFYFRLIVPFYNFSPNKFQLLIQTGKNSWFSNSFLYRFFLEKNSSSHFKNKKKFFFSKNNLLENFKYFFFLKKKVNLRNLLKYFETNLEEKHLKFLIKFSFFFINQKKKKIEIILYENFLGKFILGKTIKIGKFFLKNIRIFISSIKKNLAFSFFSKFFYNKLIFKIFQREKSQKNFLIFSDHSYLKKGRLISKKLGKIMTALVRQKSGILIIVPLDLKN
ncbi:hypothetical protein HAN_2g248 (nucleomorph) [Hemiselmis andersenii]|uniref:Uncharacterized protein n=1 Tax=Hemiselmis andersenii TaxID=464988 RepID=A9BKR8_HEMAN|nr:hypothetical protein HAN_2g248 [Hemiselmis andersenii]ABW98073.1 hypothetical protein HAN_2g248 [Hemiselmis andersenii]